MTERTTLPPDDADQTAPPTGTAAAREEEARPQGEGVPAPPDGAEAAGATAAPAPARGAAERAPSEARDADEGRRRHYGHFYGLEPLPEGDILTVMGGCQAEATRRLLCGEPGRAEGGTPASVRVPPMFELGPDDLPHLLALLERTTVLVVKPVRDDYQGLPLGIDQLESLIPDGARSIRVPVLYDTSRFPWQVTLRHPQRPWEDPPVVPYHDLRTVAEAAAQEGLIPWPAALRRPGQGDDDAGPRLPLSPEAIRGLAAESVQRLREREERFGTVVVSDAVAAERGAGFHSANHPDNPLLEQLARAVLAELGVDKEVRAPERLLLGHVLSPIEGQIVEALDLEVEPREHWVVGGEPVSDADVREAHLGWFRDNPVALAPGLERHGALMRQLGLL